MFSSRMRYPLLRSLVSKTFPNSDANNQYNCWLDYLQFDQSVTFDKDTIEKIDKKTLPAQHYSIDKSSKELTTTQQHIGCQALVTAIFKSTSYSTKKVIQSYSVIFFRKLSFDDSLFRRFSLVL